MSRKESPVIPTIMRINKFGIEFISFLNWTCLYYYDNILLVEEKRVFTVVL
jgi:hypothetical protein